MNIFKEIRRRIIHEPKQIWIDVGANRGQKTIDAAWRNRDLKVYAFEPNFNVASETLGLVPNYIMIPFAVSEIDGIIQFNINYNDACSSMLEIDPVEVAKWISDKDISRTTQRQVCSIRLDTFMRHMKIAFVHYLKIDAQGADLSVIRSLGNRLSEIGVIEVEVCTKTKPVYFKGALKSEIMDYMLSSEFRVISETCQSYNQEQNIIFSNSRIDTKLILNQCCQ